MYTCQFFEIQELVPQHIYHKFGDKSWMFLNPKILTGIDLLRGSMNEVITINNWHIGGNRQWSGFRTPEFEGYSPTSQHSLGNAVDLMVMSLSANQVREHLYDNLPRYRGLIKGIEEGVTWVHIDCRNIDPNDDRGYYIFNP